MELLLLLRKGDNYNCHPLIQRLHYKSHVIDDDKVAAWSVIAYTEE